MAVVKQIPLTVAALVLMVSALSSRALARDGCLECHRGLGDKPSALFPHDIHAMRGVTCAGCHGGDSSTDDMDKGMSKAAGFTGKPSGDEISVMCARCHADSATMAGFGSHLPTGQFAALRESVHGRLSLSGKERIVQCTTCHGAHGIVPPGDRASPVNPLNIVATCTSCHNDAQYIRKYNPGLAVDQLEKYRTSVHGVKNASGDARVAECASCHGSHGILPAKDVRSKVYPTNLPETCASCHSDPEHMRGYGIPTDQFAKYSSSVHGVALLQKKDLGAPACNSCHGNHGATPPGVTSISKVCGTCHALNADLFSASPHKGAFDAANLPECETCHGNHGILPATSALLGVGPDAVCSRCHSAGDSGYVAAAGMRALADSLESGETHARALVEEAEQKGMEIAEAKFRLRDSRQAGLEARTMVHSFDGARFASVVGKGLAVNSSVVEEASATVHEFYFRRVGLGVATLIITLLAVSLYLYVRRIERRQAGR
jgi:hypothetical protein